jgi:hypothetical protein
VQRTNAFFDRDTKPSTPTALTVRIPKEKREVYTHNQKQVNAFSSPHIQVIITICLTWKGSEWVLGY